MKVEIQNLCLEYIIAEWKHLRPLQIGNETPVIPPWGVWIRLYEPILVDQNDLRDHENIIVKVWFLTEQGLEERDPWAYSRFVTVKGYRPWSNMTQKPRESVWGDKFHEIGLGAFAGINGTDKIYLETQWGGKLGRGCRMKIDEQGSLEVERVVWVS